MIKALFLTNFKHVCHINEYFFGTFIFIINIGFMFGSHLTLYYLDHLDADQLLTGVMENPKPISSFHLSMTIILFVISTLSSLVIVAKKFEAYWKDKKMAKDLNIMINHSDGQQKQNFNNQKHNQPIMNFFVLVLLISISIGFMAGFLIHFNGSVSEHIKSFWVSWAGNLFLRTIFPVLTTTFHLKHFRSFILKIFHELWENFG